MQKFIRIVKNNALFFILFLCVLLFLLYKVRIGYMYNDEPYILSLGHRLFLGDRLIFDEWHPAQLVGLFILPFMHLFKLFSPYNNEGIILAFRYFYVLIWSVFVLFIYFKLKSKVSNKLPLIFGIMYLYLFASMDQMTLSYNMWTLGSMMIVITLVTTIKNVNTYYIVGIFLSIATMLCPYLIILYVIYAILVAYYNNFSKVMLNPLSVLKWDNFLRVSSICIILCMLLFVYILSNGTLKQLLSNVEYIFADPSYNKFSLVEKATRYFYYIFRTFKVFLSLSIPVFVISLIDKKRVLFYFLLLTIFYLFSLYSVSKNIDLTWFNQMMFPICILGAYSYIHLEGNKNIFKYFFLGGIIFSFCAYMTSDTEIIAICFGLSISGFASFILISEFLEENLNIVCRSKLIRESLVAFILISQVLSTFYARYHRTYFDRNINKIDTILTKGPGKDLYTSFENSKKYEITYNDYINQVEKLKENTDSVSILLMDPWLYLVYDYNYSIYSSWTFADKELRIQAFENYIEVTRKIPDAVYFLKDDFTLDDLKFLTEKTKYRIIENDYSIMLEKE